MRRRIAGFTLIELMIVVAVIAALAAIAYPTYSSYVRKAARGQAKADLVELAQDAERYHTVNSDYSGFTLPFTASPQQGQARYTLSIENQAATTFTLKATPTQVQQKDSCGTLTLNQAGAKTHSSGDADCW